jgi:hypothetical protein
MRTKPRRKAPERMEFMSKTKQVTLTEEDLAMLRVGVALRLKEIDAIKPQDADEETMQNYYKAKYEELKTKLCSNQ